MRVREIAERLGCTFEGDGEREITRAAPLGSAGATELAFVGNRRAAREAGNSAAGCLILPEDFPNDPSRTAIRSPDPRGAFAQAVSLLHPAPSFTPGVHRSATVAASARLGDGVSIGPGAVIGERTRIGTGTRVGPGCVVGDDVDIGEHCTLWANVTIYSVTLIGNRVTLHAGCVLGADGFGFVMTGGRYEKFPQIGRVCVEDAVEIGANSCVDRAALGETVIGEGSKLDNQVHIGHNCRIGKHVVIAAQTGLSGGVVVGDYAVIGGQVGIGDKARIESGAVLGSGSGVLTSKIVKAGGVMWGTPARPLKEYLEQLALVGKLPEMRETLREMRERLDRLERSLKRPSET